MNVYYDLSYTDISFGSPLINWRFDQRAKALSASNAYTPAIQTDQFSEYELYDFPGWDGYNAIPIEHKTVMAARAFYGLLPMNLRAPDIAPGADGTIGFEWRSGSDANRIYYTIEVGPGDKVIASIYYPNNKIWRSDSTSVLTGAASLVEDLFR